MSSATDLSAHVLRARRTAAGARGVIGVAAIVIVTGWPGMSARPALATAGFSFILLTSLVQGLAPRLSLLAIEESLAGAPGCSSSASATSGSTCSAFCGSRPWRGRAGPRRPRALDRPRRAARRARPARRCVTAASSPSTLGLIVAVIWLLLTCGRVTAS